MSKSMPDSPTPGAAGSRDVGADVRAVLFDLDGTLVDTAIEIAQALNRTFDELGLRAPSLEQVRTLIGRGVRSLVERALDGRGVQDVDVSRIVARFEAHYGATIATSARLYPDVAAAIELLEAHQFALGVVTNKPRSFTERLLDRFDLRRHLAVIIAGDDGLRKKPEADMVRAACRQIGVPPRHTIFVGDSVNDVEAARGAGCRVWCVPYGYNEGRPLEALACDRLVPTVLAAAHCIVFGSDEAGPAALLVAEQP